MPSGILVIGEEERERIATMIKRARAKPVKRSVVEQIGMKDPTPEMKLSDRPSDFQPAQPMISLGTYTVAFSFEEQPSGLIRHLSVSSARRGKVPGVPVIVMIAKEFGFTTAATDWLVAVAEQREPAAPAPPVKFWLEEFDPGHHAVNLIELVP